MFTKQNKSLHTRYIYKTKIYKEIMFTKKLKIQSLQKIMFTKQNKVYKHVMFAKQKCTDKLFLQNKTNTTVYKHVMFIKKQYKTGSLQTRYVYKTKSLHTSYVYKTK